MFVYVTTVTAYLLFSLTVFSTFSPKYFLLTSVFRLLRHWTLFNTLCKASFEMSQFPVFHKICKILKNNHSAKPEKKSNNQLKLEFHNLVDSFISLPLTTEMH